MVSQDEIKSGSKNPMQKSGSSESINKFPERNTISGVPYDEAYSASNPMVFIYSTPHFSNMVFMKEFIIQMSFPFCIPFLENYHVRFMYMRSMRGIIVMVVIPALFYIVLVTSLVKTWYDGVVPLILYAMHRFLIAVKYASMHPVEYQRLMRMYNPDLILRLQSQAQILSAWVGGRDEVLEFEVDGTCSKLGLDADSATFRFREKKCKNRLKHLVKYVGMDPKEVVQKYSNKELNTVEHCISLRNLAVAMLRCTKFNTYYRDVSYKLNAVLTIAVTVAVPLRFLENKVSEDQMAIYWVFIAASMGLVLNFYPLIAQFLYGGLYDYLRRADLAKMIMNLIRLDDELDMECMQVMGDRTQGNGNGVESTESKKTVAETMNSAILGCRVNRSADSGNDSDSDDDFRLSDFSSDAYYNNENLPAGWGPNRLRESVRAQQPMGTPADDGKRSFAEFQKVMQLKMTDMAGVKEGPPPLPMLDFTIPGNLNTTFGSRWAARIDSYLGAFLLLNIFIGVYIVYTLFEFRSIASDGASDIRLIRDIMTAEFVGLNLISLNILTALVIIVLVAASVNQMFESHRYCVGLKGMAIENAATSLFVQREAKLNAGVVISAEDDRKFQAKIHLLGAISESCNRVSEFMGVSNNVTPIRVLGIPATYAVAGTILTALGTVLTSIVSAFSKDA